MASWQDLPPLRPELAQYRKMADPAIFMKLTGQQQVELLAEAKKLEKTICEERYRTFFRYAWEVIEPDTKIYWNWHIDYLCDELQKQVQRVAAKEPKEYDLVINISPRSLKSSIVSKLFNPWVWIGNPGMKFLTLSYSGDLAVEHALSSRRLILSEWYKEHWGNQYSLTSDQNLKCLKKGTNILRSSGAIDVIENIKGGDSIQSFSNGKIVSDTVLKIVNTGRKKTVRISLSDGSSICATKEHRLYGFNSWVTVDNIKVGDCVAVARNTIGGGSKLTTDDAFFLAFYIADGTKSGSSVHITKESPELSLRLKEVCERKGWKIWRSIKQPCLININGKHRNYRKSDNPMNYLRSFGLMPVKTHEIRVPQEIMSGSKEVVIEFLSTYFSTDGHISCGPAYCANITSVSHDLIIDLQILLKRIGVQCRIHESMGAYTLNGVKKQTRMNWTLAVGQKESVALLECLHIYDNQDRMNRLLSHKKNKSNNSGIVPPEFRSLLFNTLGWYGWRGIGMDVGEKGWATREEVIAAAKMDGNQKLIDIMNSDIEWREVVAISEEDEEETYDIQMKNNWSFVANGVISHNSYYENDRSGYRMAAGLQGIATGRGGNIIVIDDPISVQDSDSEAERKKVISWWTQTMPTRLNNRAFDFFVIVQQRTNTEDLTGYILENQGRKFKHICIPAEETDKINPKELRKFYVGGLYFPSHPAFTTESLGEARRDMGPYAYSGQMLQQPSPQSGGDFQRHYWRFWRHKGQDLSPVNVSGASGDTRSCMVEVLPDRFDDVLCSWDMTFKNLKTSDYVVGQAWGRRGADRYLLSQIRRKMNFTESCKAVKELRAMYPKCSGILIEDKANGTAIINQLKGEIPGIIAVLPLGSKYARALPMARQCEAGNIYIPHKLDADWVPDFIERFANFPNVAKDDEIDAASQAINKLSSMKRVFPVYNGSTVNINVDWGSLDQEIMPICSEWVSKKMTTDLIIALWNKRHGRLAILREIHMDSVRPGLMITTATNIVREMTGSLISNLKTFTWYGNDLMFSGETSGDIKDAYGKYDIYPVQNDKFDEQGSIVQIMQLRSWKKLLIDSNASETSRQMASWCFEGKYPQKDGFGLCFAMCNLVGALYRFGHVTEPDRLPKAYSKKKTEHQKRIEQMAKNGDWIGIEKGSMPQRGKSGSWIL